MSASMFAPGTAPVRPLTAPGAHLCEPGACTCFGRAPRPAYTYDAPVGRVDPTPADLELVWPSDRSAA